MMEIKEAIEFLRSIRPIGCGKCLFIEITGECNPECDNPKHRKYIDMAIEALKAWNTRAEPEPRALTKTKIPGIGKCPKCKIELCDDDKDLHFCPTCGQAVYCQPRNEGEKG